VVVQCSVTSHRSTNSVQNGAVCCHHPLSLTHPTLNFDGLLVPLPSCLMLSPVTASLCLLVCRQTQDMAGLFTTSVKVSLHCHQRGHNFVSLLLFAVVCRGDYVKIGHRLGFTQSLESRVGSSSGQGYLSVCLSVLHQRYLHMTAWDCGQSDFIRHLQLNLSEN